MSSARWQTPTSSAATAARTRSAAPDPSTSPSPATRPKRRVESIVENGSTSASAASSSSARSPSSSTITAADGASAASSRVPTPAAASPATSAGSQRERCSGVPAAWITAAAVAVARNGVAAQAYPSSSSRTASSTVPSPCPPCSLATAIPGQPSSTSSRHKSGSYAPASAASRTRANGERADKSSRATSLICFCSSVRSKSMWVSGRAASAAPGQAERPLGHDVLEDLGGAALDRVAAGAQQFIAPRPAGRQRLGSDHLRRQLGELLVGLRPHPLGERSLGPRLAVALDGGQSPVGGQPQHLDLQVQLAQTVGDQRVGQAASPLGLGQQLVEQLAKAHLQEECQPGPLVHQRGQRHLPAVADAAQHVLVPHPRPLDEQLVELRLAGDLAQRADLHPLLLHVEQKVGETPVLGHLGVGARQQHAPLRVLGAAGPHLLSGDHPAAVVPHRPRLQRGQIRSRLGLGEALAPD